MIPRILVITPPSGVANPDCVKLAQSEGLPLGVLLRDPGSAPTAPLHPDHRLAPLREAALEAGLPVLLSTHPEDAAETAGPARRAGLSGLQLRGDPSPVALARARAAWPEAIVGASVHGEPRPLEADYVVFAPVFTPRTASAVQKHAVGVKPLAAWTAVHPRVLALGGITPQSAPQAVRAGAHGLAGISTFLGETAAVAETLRALATALTVAPDVSPPR